MTTPANLPSPANPTRAGFSIAALVLGLFAAPARMAGPGIGFTIGAAAVVCAVLALRQISHGRATGRGMAVWGLIFGLFFALSGFSTLTSSGSSTTAASTVPASTSTTVVAPAVSVPAAPSYPLSTITAGTYLVGSEVTPGSYVTEGASFCYWSRLKDTSGGFGSIIANGNAPGHTTVTIKSSDQAFQLSGACTFTKR